MTQTLEREQTIDHDRLRSLFVELARAVEHDDESDRAMKCREEQILAYMPVAGRIAHRFDGRGPASDDLVQVARLALVRAVDRFDPFKGSDFLSFAVPTIVGELKRHFRDSTWTIRVPRRLQEMHLNLRTATDELYQQLGHSPNAAELAQHLGVPVEEVREGLEVTNVYTPRSLDEPGGDEPDSPGLAQMLGAEDPDLEKVVYYASLSRAIKTLDERERYILRLRFYAELSQAKIAERIGVSQMQVSRILARILDKLRTELAHDAESAD
jgi:RNA polymerase sigma-B factor